MRNHTINIILLFCDCFIGVVTLPFQIIDLARDGHALNKNQQSEKAQEFRQLAQNLTTQVDNVTQRMEEIINWHDQQQNHQDNRQTITFNLVIAIFSAFFLKYIFILSIKTNECLLQLSQQMLVYKCFV